MKSIATSELKAKLAKYLRLVRQGEVIQIQDRGVPIATLRGIDRGTLSVIQPVMNPDRLGQLTSEVKQAPKKDVVELLIEERRKR